MISETSLASSKLTRVDFSFANDPANSTTSAKKPMDRDPEARRSVTSEQTIKSG